MISGEDFERTIQNFDRNFSLHLMDLLEKLSHYSTIDCEHQMLNIIARLDHNGYYTAQLEKKAAEGETYSIFLSHRMRPRPERPSTWLFVSSVITLNLNSQFRTCNIILCFTLQFYWRFLLGCNNLILSINSPIRFQWCQWILINQDFDQVLLFLAIGIS